MTNNVCQHSGSRIVLFLFVFFLISIPVRLLAWGNTGHRVIAQIAEENLPAKTRKKIRKLLEGYPMAYWANWADFIKSDTTGKWEHTYIWHYINIPGNLTKQEFPAAIRAVKQENVYSRIPVLQQTLQHQNTSDEEKRIALYFLIHLVGDLHQPMHIGRAEDLGGNRIRVTWFGDPTNIHAVWDSRMIDFEQYSYREYADILNTLNREQKSGMQQGSPEDWLFETYQITNDVYAGIRQGDELRYEYNYQYKTIMEQQLLRAGLRLAKILTDSFK